MALCSSTLGRDYLTLTFLLSKTFLSFEWQFRRQQKNTDLVLQSQQNIDIKP